MTSAQVQLVGGPGRITLAGLRRCDSCGVVMAGPSDACPMCGTPYAERAVHATARPAPAPAATAAPSSSQAPFSTAPTPHSMHARPASEHAADDRPPDEAHQPDETHQPAARTDHPTPTRAPAPPDRPDPYSQIANPLNTGWGTSAPTTAPSQTATTKATTRTIHSPWRKRAIVALVVVALAVGAWLAREPLGDAVEDVRERIEDVLGDNSEALGSGVTLEENREFQSWEEANIDSLRGLLDSVGADLERTEERGFWNSESDQPLSVTQNIARTLVEFNRRVEGAPESQLRTDVLSAHLALAASHQRIATGIVTGDDAAVEQGRREAGEAREEIDELAEEYSRSTALFRL